MNRQSVSVNIIESVAGEAQKGVSFSDCATARRVLQYA